jgi:XTP/dITP diphosphohydrolase
MNSMENKLKAFKELLDIMDELREKCPWDRQQTLQSLRSLTIEETYELADAVLKEDLDDIRKELGDLLLHIVFFAKIGEEKGAFDIGDVARSINEKLVYRHPHVFGQVLVKDAEEVKENWEHLKIREGNSHVLSGVPSSLPALIKAKRIQEKVRGVGFDWKNVQDVWVKIEEELQEVKQEMHEGPTAKLEEELGDVFFSLVNAARHLDIDPENALERTNQKFIRRFHYLEEMTLKKGKSLKEMSLEDMDRLWEEAKKYDTLS